MKERVKRALTRSGLRVERMSAEERRLRRGYDPLHAPAATERAQLSATNPRLRELEATYAADESPMGARGLWTQSAVADDVRLEFFRGDNLYLWQYTRSPTVNRYRTFIYGRYVESIDRRGLLQQLDEDGAFGCFTFDYVGLPVLSRDLLDSVAELSFLDQHVGLFDRPGLRVLDIGAGYGRLAHRMLAAAPAVEHYWCVDAVPRSTFLCEFYLRYRGLSERSTVLELPQLARGVRPDRVDLALNVHSFSEMPRRAVEAWVRWLAELEVATLVIVPNERTQLLSREPDGTRQDCSDVLQRHGYRREVVQPTITDPAVRELLDVNDHFLLYRRS